VLFLDRTHPRARAYIDRARTALAEVQRRSEELLQTSRELLGQGRTDAARQLLAEAIATSGDDVQSATLRAELERRERAQGARAPVDVPAPQEAVPGWKWTPTSPLVIALVGVAALGVLLAGVVLLDLSDAERPPAVTGPATDSRLSTPSASQVLCSERGHLSRAGGLRKRFRNSMASHSPAPNASKPILFASKSSSCCLPACVRHQGTLPRRSSGDEMSKVSLPEFRSRPAVQELRLRPRR
jgi:hypothetical protein